MSRAARKNSEPDLAAANDGPDPHLHAGKCTICRHPQRVEIERAFVDWASPLEITKAFGLASRSTIYRHARARGLFEIRRRNLHYGLGRIAEHAADVKPSAANVIAAFIAMAKINARGEWDNGHRFDTQEALDHARWELLSAAARENELEDTLEGQLAPVPAAQNHLHKGRAKYIAEMKAKAAKEAAEASKQAERQAEAGKQAKEKKPERTAEPQAQYNKEERKQETRAELESQPATAAPSNPAPQQAREKKRSEPEEPRPHPTPQPPPNAPRPEDRGPYQISDSPRPREKILFARRRGRRPVVP